MRKLVLIASLAVVTSFYPSEAAQHSSRTAGTAARQRRIRHKRHVKTAKRVGVGAAGGAAIGALAGGGKGAAIGAAAGGGGGALYDKHKKDQAKRQER